MKKQTPSRQRAQRPAPNALLHWFTLVLEHVIAGLLVIAVLYFTVRLAGSIFHLPGFPQYEAFEEILNLAFSLVIGIEIIRMMCEHSPDVVFEVLAFAIARQVVIDHTHAIDNLWGLSAIAILFLVRKYLSPETMGQHGSLSFPFRRTQPEEEEETVPSGEEDRV